VSVRYARKSRYHGGSEKVFASVYKPSMPARSKGGPAACGAVRCVRVVR